jgi:hypothetical protein
MNQEPNRWIVGVILLSSAAFWLCFLNIYKLESVVVPGLISLLITVVCAVVFFRKSVHEVERKWSILLIPCAISVIIVPYPYNMGLLLLALGFFFLAVLPRVCLWLGCALSGLILTVQAAGLGIYYLVIPSGHSATFFSYIVYPFLRISGFAASLDKGTIFIQKAGDVFPFPITWDTLGVYPLLLVVLPALTFLLLKSETADQALKRFFSFLGVSAVYILLRYILLLHFYFAGDLGIDALEKFKTIFFSPWWMFITFVPLVVLLVLIYEFNLDIEFPKFKMRKKRAAALCALFVSSFLLSGAVLFQEQGVKKQGRVLVDEIHSTWEPSYLIMDKYWYGTESTYNAYSMIEWLKVPYDVDRVVSPAFIEWNPGENISKIEPELVSAEITSDILRNYDILILKTPNMYTQGEVAAIVDFVKNGGGLFVVGDHSNFAGTSTSLNEITRHFGMEFVFDSVNSVEGRLSIYNRGKIAHPCAKYMPEFDFLTSCSIAVPATVGQVITGYALSAEPGEYASTGFFRETRRDLPILATDRGWGIFHQCVALEYGKGRVAAFADSTTISNFRIFFGGSDAMTIGCMEWLNYKNAYPYMTKVMWIAGIVFAGLGVVLLEDVDKKKRIGAVIVIICIMALGNSLSIAAFSPRVYEKIPARFYDRENTVCFDQYHSSEVVNSGDREGNYSVFLIWTQRVGRVPSIEYTLEDCIEKGKTVIIVDPLGENFSHKDIELLKEHVQTGGNVFMMVDRANVLGINLLAAFGLEIEEIRKPMDAEEEGPLTSWGPSVKGGEALETIGERVILARVSYGEGYFVLCTVSHVFRDGFRGQPGYMGYNGSDPDLMSEEEKEFIMKIYNLEYRLFEEILI